MDLTPPTEEFLRLSSQYSIFEKMTLEELCHYLENYPGLTSDELLFTVATAILSNSSVLIANRLLSHIANDTTLVAAYARAISGAISNNT